MDKDENMERFLADSSDFINSFKPTFVDYFVSLCFSYDKFYSEETLKEVALVVYEDVFNIDIFITTLEEDVFDEMLEDGVMIGFLINRSMLFLLENYLKDTQNKKNSNYNNLESLVFCISEYVREFEKQICDKNKLQPLHVNFDTIDNLSSGDNIIDIFKNIKDNGEEITFFNLYKGVPIKHSAIITDIDDDEVAFKTIQTQEVAMKMDGKAYILKDNHFNKYLKADIVYSNFSNNTIVLSNFTYLLNMPATNRKYIRANPDIMAEVSLSSEKELITRGKLFDLSINGIGIISEENNGIYVGAKIDLSFSLSTTNNESGFLIKAEGEVLNIIEYSNSYRYCLKIYPSIEDEEKIRDYVKLREVETLDSLSKEVDKYKIW